MSTSRRRRQDNRHTSPKPIAHGTDRGTAKRCQLDGCGQEFTRNTRSESIAQFERRMYCSKPCSSAARRTPGGKAERKQATAVPVPELRIVDGVWRPSAPGWPDRPRVMAVVS